MSSRVSSQVSWAIEDSEKSSQQERRREPCSGRLDRGEGRRCADNRGEESRLNQRREKGEEKNDEKVLLLVGIGVIWE